MPRPNTLVVAGSPHHIIKRWNNRQAIFFKDANHQGRSAGAARRAPRGSAV